MTKDASDNECFACNIGKITGPTGRVTLRHLACQSSDKVKRPEAVDWIIDPEATRNGRGFQTINLCKLR